MGLDDLQQSQGRGSRHLLRIRQRRPLLCRRRLRLQRLLSPELGMGRRGRRLLSAERAEPHQPGHRRRLRQVQQRPGRRPRPAHTPAVDHRLARMARDLGIVRHRAFRPQHKDGVVGIKRDGRILERVGHHRLPPRRRHHHQRHQVLLPGRSLGRRPEAALRMDLLHRLRPHLCPRRRLHPHCRLQPRRRQMVP